MDMNKADKLAAVFGGHAKSEDERDMARQELVDFFGEAICSATGANMMMASRLGEQLQKWGEHHNSGVDKDLGAYVKHQAHHWLYQIKEDPLVYSDLRMRLMSGTAYIVENIMARLYDQYGLEKSNPGIDGAFIGIVNGTIYDHHGMDRWISRTSGEIVDRYHVVLELAKHGVNTLFPFTATSPAHVMDALSRSLVLASSTADDIASSEFFVDQLPVYLYKQILRGPVSSRRTLDDLKGAIDELVPLFDRAHQENVRNRALKVLGYVNQTIECMENALDNADALANYKIIN